MKRSIACIAAGLLLSCGLAFGQTTSGSGAAPPPIPDNPDSLFGPQGNSASGGSTSSGSTADSQTAQPAQGTQPGSAATTESPDSMFQGGMVENATTKAQTENAGAAQALIAYKGVQLGGSLDSEFIAYGLWGNSYPDLTDLAKNFNDQLVPQLQGDLYFDARPDEHFRVFGKVQATYPYQTSQTINYLTPGPGGSLANPASASATISVPNVQLFELFSDFDYKSTVFFRVGQQVVNWGVGYFFSPADVLSLTPINPEKPTQERQGPVAAQLNLPFATVDNFYTYVIADQAFANGGTFHVDQLAVAPKLEFVVGNYELSLAGYYQKDRRPKAMVMASGSLWKLSVFGEGVVSYGADHTLVEAGAIPGTYATYTDDTTPYFTGTVGFSYLQADYHLSLFAQYLYNGQGYSNPDLVNGGYLLLGTVSVGSGGPALTASDLTQPGRHYGAAVASWSNINDSNFTLAT
ncbi:MAG TPA: hypothetical protein VMV68_06795, partial [Spirochaetia bacterium]|nr:hypothetical protein [Spirochaetia bacterium]